MTRYYPKELHAHALGYYYGRTVGEYDNLFDGEPEAWWFKRGYDLGVADYSLDEQREEQELSEYRQQLKKNYFGYIAQGKKMNKIIKEENK